MTGCLTETTLQSWLDGELSTEASAAARSHVAACESCAQDARAAEQAMSLVSDGWRADMPAAVPTARLRARLEETPVAIAPPLAAGILGGRRAVLRWSIAASILLMAITITTLVRTRTLQTKPASQQAATSTLEPQVLAQTPNDPAPGAIVSGVRRESLTSTPPRALRAPFARLDKVAKSTRRATWIESETSRHLQLTQQLLRSVRNAEPEPAFDLAYEQELSRELLGRNRLLRRRAEQQQDRGTEQVLVHVEPILLDIANLPAQPIADEVRSLKDLIRSQSLIAELQLYATRFGS